MIELNGKYTDAKVFTDFCEETAQAQIIKVINLPSFSNEQIRCMSDVHAGAGCVIGFTSTTKNKKYVPNLVGYDGGCGMTYALLGNININFKDLDDFINNEIPNGFYINSNSLISHDSKLTHEIFDISCTIQKSNKADYYLNSLGTLGGGNHFIEVNKTDEGEIYLVIHSGSRKFGYDIAQYWQKKAVEYCSLKGIKIDNSLAYLEGKFADLYCYHERKAVEFAELNRNIIINKIINFLGIQKGNYSINSTIHNYISQKDGIIRKGAISAYSGEEVLIPLNMTDGSLLCEGLGNEDWNFSAPHGAGRKLARKKAKAKIKLEDFKKSMEGIYSTSVGLSTLDEAKFAYKDPNDIIKHIGETVRIKKRLHSIYNFKAHKKEKELK